MKGAFFCELKHTMTANSVPANIRQDSSFYFEYLQDYKYKVYGVSSSGLQKEGTAEVYDTDAGEVIEGEFVEEGVTISFEISPLNTFDTELFFGGGIWIEKNADGAVRQKYNIRLWDARTSNLEGGFVAKVFDKLRSLNDSLDKAYAKASEQNDSIESLRKEIALAQQAVQDINVHKEAITQNSTHAKALVENSDQLRSNLIEDKKKLDKMLQEGAGVLQENTELMNKLSKTWEEADRVKSKADEALSSTVSVTLAKAFKERKVEASSQRNIYDVAFVVALTVGLVISLFIFSSYEGGNGGALSYLEYFFVRLPFLGIPIWLGVYASKKSSLLARIEEFYAQKQALAESYEGYKSEVSKIGGETSTELEELMRINLTSLNKDSSFVMDGNLKEAHSPFEEIFGRRIISDNKKEKDQEIS